MIVGAIVLAALLVAGLVAWIVWPKNVGREPFDRAVANLAAAEAVTYKTSLAGITTETRVTKHGDSIGTMTLAGQQFGLLGVGSATYVKAPTGLLPGSGSAALGLRNRWVVSGAGLVGASAQLAVAPPVLADRLKTIVDQATGFERSSVGDVDAYVAHAPTGDLFVTRDEPNQVLRLAPRGVPSLPSGLPSLPPLPTLPSRPALPSLPPLPSFPVPSLPNLPSIPPIPNAPGALIGVNVGVKYAEPSAPAGAQAQQPPGLDVSPMTPEQTDSLYTDLTSAGTELVQAADPTVQFTAQATGQIACGAGCTVNAAVTNQVTGTGNTTVVGAQVTAEMTAIVSVDGRPGGICVSPPTPLPANGAGQVSCVDPESGLLARVLLEQKKAAAAGKGGVVSVTVTAQVEIHATAMTQAQVRQEIDRLKQQQQQARGSRAPPVYPPEGLKVGPVNLGTRQAGTTAPVRVEGLSNPWKVTEERLKIEAALGGNLPKGTKAFDVYSGHDGGTGISIKSIDPRADSYKFSPSSIGSTGNGFVDNLANYRSGIDIWNPTIPPNAVSVWVLRLAYPAGTTDPAVLAQFNRVVEYGRSKNIVVQLVPIEG